MMEQRPLVQMETVSFRYPGADNWVLKNISLTIDRHDFIAIIGSNGAGKSTLCKAINGLIPHYYVGDFEGEVIVSGESTRNASVASMSKHVAYVYQDFENQLVRPTVYEEVLFSPMNYGFQDYKVRAEMAMSLLELTHLRDKYIWELSGGQKHLVALAGALALDPEILIIDEPVAQLDPAHARELYDKLKHIHTTTDKTVIVIEHHTEFIADYCKDVILMDGGSVVWKKPVREALNCVDELTALNIFPPQVTMAAKLSSKQPASEPLPITLEQGAEWFNRFSAQAAAPIKLKLENTPVQQPILSLEHMNYGYKQLNRKIKVLLKEINLDIYENERVALVGSNGAGKSTILKLIARLLKPQKGQISFDGRSLMKASPEKAAEHISYIFQNPEEMFIEDSIKKDVAYYLVARKNPAAEQITNHSLETFKLQSIQERDGRLLSGGQQRRASLAVGLAMQPAIMLLDEPTASLDLATRRELVRMLKKIEGTVRASIIATHDMQLVAEWATRVIVLHQGEILADLTPRELFESEALLKQAGLVPPQIVSLCHRLNRQPAALSVEEFMEKIVCQEATDEQFSKVLSKA